MQFYTRLRILASRGVAKQLSRDRICIELTSCDKDTACCFVSEFVMSDSDKCRR